MSKKIFKGDFWSVDIFGLPWFHFFTVLSTVLKTDFFFFHQISWKLPQLPTVKCNNIPVSHSFYITIINFKVSLLFYKVEPSPGIHIISPLIFSETCITDDASSLSCIQKIPAAYSQHLWLLMLLFFHLHRHFRSIVYPPSLHVINYVWKIDSKWEFAV